MSKIDEVWYEVGPAPCHADDRRSVYDLSSLTEVFGFKEEWFPRELIVVNRDNPALGNHYHESREMCFTPTGGFEVRLVDIDSRARRRFALAPGSRLIIPERVAHRFTGNKGAVLLAYNTSISPVNLKCPPEISEIFASQ